MNTLLNTRNLSIGYGAKVLSSALDLFLEQGKFVSLLGPNGAGKSTLLKTISGLHPALEGEIDLHGKPIQQWSSEERARRLSIVMTESVNALLTVHDLVSLGRFPHTNWMGQLQEADLEAIGFAMESTGLHDLSEERISELSDGQVQKAMIARALAQDGDIILLDEPTAHLDISNRASVMKLLKDLSHQRGKGILVSTHDLELALEVSDEIWLMDQSGNITIGIPEELMMIGEFNRVFDHKDLQFDREKGGFRISTKQPGIPLAIQGRGARLVWTIRALQRIGFKPQERGMENVALLVVNDDNWVLKSDQTEDTFDRLADLLEAIDKLR